jgi:hypothetical protein
MPEPIFGFEKQIQASSFEKPKKQFGIELDMTETTLRDIVERYRALASGFGQPLALGEFALSRPETERVFGMFDEDYHISRFFHFTLDPAFEPEGAYQINGFPQSHVSLDAEIETIL